MDRFRQDLVVSLRRLRSSPGFTLAAILTLALGIGANIAIFTVVNALLFRPLPVRQPDELVALNMRGYHTEFPVQSYLNYLDFRDRNNVLAGLAGYRMAPVSFSRGNSNNARIWAFEVTGNYFDVLGVGALRGRVFNPKDDVTRGGHPIIVITYASWQTPLCRRSQRCGPENQDQRHGLHHRRRHTARIRRHRSCLHSRDLCAHGDGAADRARKRLAGSSAAIMNMFVVGRLKPGVTLARAEAQLNSIAAGAEPAVPEGKRRSHRLSLEGGSVRSDDPRTGPGVHRCVVGSLGPGAAAGVRESGRFIAGAGVGPPQGIRDSPGARRRPRPAGEPVADRERRCFRSRAELRVCCWRNG